MNEKMLWLLLNLASTWIKPWITWFRLHVAVLNNVVVSDTDNNADDDQQLQQKQQHQPNEQLPRHAMPSTCVVVSEQKKVTY